MQKSPAVASKFLHKKTQRFLLCLFLVSLIHDTYLISILIHIVCHGTASTATVIYNPSESFNVNHTIFGISGFGVSSTSGFVPSGSSYSGGVSSFVVSASSVKAGGSSGFSSSVFQAFAGFPAFRSPRHSLFLFR